MEANDDDIRAFDEQLSLAAAGVMKKVIRGNISFSNDCFVELLTTELSTVLGKYYSRPRADLITSTGTTISDFDRFKESVKWRVILDHDIKFDGLEIRIIKSNRIKVLQKSIIIGKFDIIEPFYNGWDILYKLTNFTDSHSFRKDLFKKRTDPLEDLLELELGNI